MADASAYDMVVGRGRGGGGGAADPAAGEVDHYAAGGVSEPADDPGSQLGAAGVPQGGGAAIPDAVPGWVFVHDDDHAGDADESLPGEVYPDQLPQAVGKSSIHPVRDFTNFTILIIRICAYFKPLNVFVPPALVMIALGVLKGIKDYGLSIT